MALSSPDAFLSKDANYLLNADLEALIDKFSERPLPPLKADPVYPSLNGALLGGLLIAVVVLRPLWGVFILTAYLFELRSLVGVAFGLFFFAQVFTIVSKWSVTKPGVHAGHPLTKLQYFVREALKPKVEYKPPLGYACGFFCTVFSFFLYRPNPVAYKRQWIAGSDGERFYVDWLLPSSGVIDSIAIVLHGLNGASDANYVVDVGKRLAQSNIAIACMVNRGMGDSYVTGEPSAWFSTTRTSDLNTVVETIERLIEGYRTVKSKEDDTEVETPETRPTFPPASLKERIPLYLIGFSNGGNILANFVGKMGSTLENRIDACVCISATLRAERSVRRVSSSIFQGPMTWLLMKKLLPRVCAAAQKAVLPEWLRFWCIPEIDRYIMYESHGFDEVDNYYKEFSIGSAGHFRNVAVPLLFIHAKDDPVFHIDDTALEECIIGNSLITYLVTETGGHVGWPDALSIKGKWCFLSDVIQRYFSAVRHSCYS